MFGRITNLISGNYNEKQIKKTEPIIATINEIDASLHDLSDVAIKAKTTEFKEKIAAGTSLDDILPEAFAVVKQACRRMVGKKFPVKGEERERNMVPYDVQLIGGIMLHQGKIAEMKTGEGKTLVAALPVYLNALTGEGVHVVTVNDYLASRDAEWMGHLYTWLGLTIGCVVKSTSLRGRREEYAKDITYVENSELGFDYLRDNLVAKMDQRNVLRRPLAYTIVDEVDSILIDEARTPLIISEPDKAPTDKYAYYAKIITTLVPAKGKKKVSKGFLAELLQENEKMGKNEKGEEDDQQGDYFLDEKAKTALLSSTGITRLEKMLGVENLYRDIGYEEIHHIENALKAQACYQKDKEYIVRDGQILIVDEHTGRTMPGRRFSEGLHQAIEAKEGVEIQRESKTLATITYQNFFKLYKKIAGMTGTATTEGEEFDKIYNLEVIAIPTHRDTIRVDKHDKVYFNQEAKWGKILTAITFAHGAGQPILIGTSNIATSEYMSDILQRKAIPHSVLNAKYHEQEAHIVANAGKFNSVVVATNMAGRGTDIKLEDGLNDRIALHYAKRLKNEERKIIQETGTRDTAKGKKGKKEKREEKDIPSGVAVNVYSAIEWDITKKALTQIYGFSSLDFQEMEQKGGLQRDGKTWTVRYTKNKKGSMLPYVVCTYQTEIGSHFVEQDFHYGLFILGTEKHESRRIDNQLRGRAGRQGDPGVSVFYVGLDDLLMRKMGGEKIQAIARMLLPAEELGTFELVQKQFTSSITRAQKQMEGRHFGVRKHLFEYDSVVDKQRQMIYQKRDELLAKASENSDDLSELSVIPETPEENSLFKEIHSFVPVIARQIVDVHTGMKTPSVDFIFLLKNEFGLELSQEAYTQNKNNLQKHVEDLFHAKIDAILGMVQDTPKIQDYWRRIYLQSIDMYWVEHIDDMHRLREKVGLMGYAQIDPLVVYKKEAFESFQTLLLTIKRKTLTMVCTTDYGTNQTVVPAPETQEDTEALVAMLKGVAAQVIPARAVVKQAGPVMHEKNAEFEVFEINEDERQNEGQVSYIDTNTKKKCRPNDKVTVQYQNGSFEYDVKYKKVEADVLAGKCRVV